MNQPSSGVAVAAGMRGASWNLDRMSEQGFTMTPFPLATQDGQRVLGYLFARGGENHVAFIMHPREMVVTHYMVPDVLEAGWACWVQGPRSVGNDMRLEHELALYDVAAGMKKLRELGFRKVAMIGNSGGAGLFAFYDQQALTAPDKRIARTPGGRPTKLDTADLPAPDGLVLLSPHPGQGALLLSGLDPSVTDEADPFSVDAALDPFDPANGFRRPPASSTYSPDFLERYRAGQRVRCERIDALARSLLERKSAARARLKDTPNRRDKLLASHAPIFTVWRTDADPRCWDTAIDPSDRLVGSLWGSDPAVSNLGSVGFGRVCTPESWLSTWSGLSSNASMAKCAPAIEQPTLVIEYTGDNCVFPADVDRIYADLGTSRKSRVKVRGNHHGLALAPGEPAGQIEAGQRLRGWLCDTFGT